MLVQRMSITKIGVIDDGKIGIIRIADGGLIAMR
jgi:hypothetical protein